MIDCLLIRGAGNGRKAAAVDLASQGKRVHLFEFPEFKTNLEEVLRDKAPTGTGAVIGRMTSTESPAIFRRLWKDRTQSWFALKRCLTIGPHGNSRR